MRKIWFVTVLGLIALIGSAAWLLKGRKQESRIAEGELPSLCRLLAFEGATSVVCEMPAGAMEVAIRYADRDGKPYRSLDAFDAAMRAQGRSIVLAMNAGMYHEDMSPVGLLVEDGRQIAPLQIDDGDGNFFLKPNGVFVVDDTGAALVMETQSYAASAITPHFATQSGPMLVVDGKIHPRFEPDGQSRHVRNGVGVRGDGTIVAAISLDMVSLGKFARLFRDGLGCPNALFLDGAISALSDGNRTLLGGVYPVGPILAVTARPATP